MYNELFYRRVILQLKEDTAGNILGVVRQYDNLITTKNDKRVKIILKKKLRHETFLGSPGEKDTGKSKKCLV